MTNSVRDAVREFISAYQDLNPPNIDELKEEPSALEFMRYVARNRPFVLRKGAKEWKACRKWNDQYLRKAMEGQTVNVAITPSGNADSPLKTENGLVFIKPYETEGSFNEVLDKIQAQERGQDKAGFVCYAQTQNDNLRNEYKSLFSDIPSSIPFARIALQKEPEAINFWMGNSHSTTALHRDPYENVYVQVLGRKHFVLLPSVETPCVNERVLPAATYVTCPTLTALCRAGKTKEDEEFTLNPKLDDPPSSVPFATWDPDIPEARATEFSILSKPLRVTLDPGDLLYLPAFWYHKVKQSCSIEDVCVAVNYW
jgi:jumonji domain-containing protein 7